jgi:molecular chaperone DnaK (HSP70)
MNEQATGKPTSKKIVGDLGTTNSVVSVLEGANPNVIPNSEEIVLHRPL